MGRFLDILTQRKYDLASEINAVESLLRRKNSGSSIARIFSENFLQWPLRNNYINVETFLTQTGLAEIIENSDCEEHISVDEFTFYAEYILNMLSYIIRIASSVDIRPVANNINNVLDQLNFKSHIDKKGHVHIIEKDYMVSESSEIVQDNYGLGESIYAYNYRETAGNLFSKADILCRLYKYYETVEAQARSFGLVTLVDDISTLSNKLDIRHAPTKKQEIVIANMTKQELEEWYDELFRLFLSLIILVDYKNRRKDIKTLKGKLG